MKKSFMVISSLLTVILSCCLFTGARVKSKNYFSNIKNVLNEKEVYDRVCEIFKARNSAFITKDLTILPEYFDTSSKYGNWSLDHEVKRVKYLNDWSYARGITFTDITSQVILNKVYSTTDGVRLGILESYKFEYKYDDDPEVLNTFGVGVYHTVNLKKKNDSWIIYNDWYTDCFEDGLKAYTGDIKEIKTDNIPKLDIKKYTPNSETANTKRYKRINAVEYADKYCGGANGDGNNFKYNKKYMNFNGAGGDCTNFVSQVLGDKEGGNMRFDGTWYCAYSKYGGGAGSSAWVNADSFKNYLIYSGKGRIIKRGTFKELIESTQKFPYGAVQKLIPGDVICYVKNKNNVDHFAVVTGFDSHGYPLINSHTTDRYHVPWDLGWGDNKISFNLISIN